MKERLLFLFKLTLFFVFYSIIARLFFLIYEFNQTKALTLSDIFGTFLHGIRLDISLTGYLILFFSLITISSVFLKTKWFKLITSFFTIILISTLSIIIITDAELYKYWGFRMDTTPLMYLKNPSLALASTPTIQIVLLITGWIIYCSAFIYLYIKLVAPVITNFKPINWYYAPLFILLSGLMILPIRGSVGIAPINTGMVYFSSNLYTNHATINVAWNFFYDLAHSGQKSFNVNYMSNEKAEKIKKEHIHLPGDKITVLNNNRPNIIILVMESFSANAIEVMGGEKGITPNLNKLWHEGIAFNHIYATGTRSDRGLVAILSGYPSHPKASVMKYPKKTEQINSLCSVLNKHGYNSAYYYGGDTNFANMASYLVNSGFKRVINQDMFPIEYRNSKWGVHDEYMFDRLLTEIDTATTPFYKVMFTLSSHEPFDVPMKTKIEGNDANSKYLNSIYYTDQCLGNFIKKAKQSNWWKNTLIVLAADHSVNYPSGIKINEPKRYTIPLLWIGGAIKDTMQINQYGNQFDIPSTILGQMNIPYDSFTFSNNLFQTTKKDYAIFIYNNGFGMVNSSGSVIYDFNKQDFIKSDGDTTQMSNSAKGIFQSIISHFNNL